MAVRNSNTKSAESLFGRSQTEIDLALSRREDVTCPLCHTTPEPFAVDFQGLNLARCSTCGLEFQSPRPTFDDLTHAVYGASYHTAKEKLIDVARRYQFARQTHRFEQYILGSRRRVLDVGCGAGAFIRFAIERGWVVEGTDIVINADACTTGARLWEGQLPAIEFDDRSFDVIRFNHVLEHTQDPLAELRRARSLMSDGGILHVGVPNLAGLNIQLKTWQSRLRFKGKPWKHYGALHHLWFFTPETLTRLVTMAGFEVLDWETPVMDRSGRPHLVTVVIRNFLEKIRAGGIIDLYARVKMGGVKI